MTNNELVTVAGGLVVPVELSFTCAECQQLCHVGVRPEEDSTRCGFCWRQEQDRLAGNKDNDAGVYESDDYDDNYEDNAQTMEREYYDHRSELYNMWRREY